MLLKFSSTELTMGALERSICRVQWVHIECSHDADILKENIQQCVLF